MERLESLLICYEHVKTKQRGNKNPTFEGVILTKNLELWRLWNPSPQHLRSRVEQERKKGVCELSESEIMTIARVNEEGGRGLIYGFLGSFQVRS